MVAAGVADHDHRAARAETVAPVALPERLEHPPVIAVAVVADHAAGLEQLPGLDRPVGRSQQCADLVDRVDEGERACRVQLVRQRRDQRQREPGEVGHRSRHVAEHEQFRTMGPRAAIDDVERDPAVGERAVDRAAHVDPPATRATAGGGATARRAGGPAGGSRRGRRRARSPRRGPARRRRDPVRPVTSPGSIDRCAASSASRARISSAIIARNDATRASSAARSTGSPSRRARAMAADRIAARSIARSTR